MVLENPVELLKIEHINNIHNLGYEGSLLKGFRYIKNKYKYCKYILTMDADENINLNL